MNNTKTAHMQAPNQCIQTNLRSKYKLPCKSIAVKKKQHDLKKASLFYKMQPHKNITKSNRTNIFQI